jgi:hypothetical protein
MERVDLGVTAIGIFSPKTSGISLTPMAVSQQPSDTVGALVELRYIKSPLIGAEFNYTYGRYDQNYSLTNTTGTPSGQLPYLLTVQSKVDEISLGYVAHGPEFFGIKPFASAGVGAIEFKPTTGGGQNVQKEVRTGVYYAIGVEKLLFDSNFGIRAQFRQLFLGAPDFNENYLATGARIVTTQPGVGFFLRF